jgi:hypothetical protein
MFSCFSNIIKKRSRAVFRSTGENIKLGSYCSGLSSWGAFHVHTAETSTLLQCLPLPPPFSYKHASLPYWMHRWLTNSQYISASEPTRPHKHGFGSDWYWFATTSELVIGSTQITIQQHRNHIFHVVKVPKRLADHLLPSNGNVKMRGDLSSCTTNALKVQRLQIETVLQVKFR